MGFLNSLFGRKKPKQRLIELKLVELTGFVESSAGEKQAVIDKVVPAKFSEIKHLIKETDGLLNELDRTKIDDKGNKRFKKAAMTAKKDSIRRIKSVLQKIQPPFSSEPGKISDYCTESLSLLREKVKASAKAIAYTSLVLKDLMKEIGSRIDTIEQTLEALSDIVRENRILFEKRKLLNLVSEIDSMTLEQEANEKEIAEKRKALGLITANRKKAGERLRSLLESSAAEEMHELSDKRKNLQEEKFKLRASLIDKVAGLNKGFRKLENLNKTGRFVLSKESTHSLKLFLDDPINLFKQDPKGEKFKQLLEELRESVVSGKLDFKEKEREKKMNEINSLIGFDFFSEFFWKENNYDKKLIEVKEGLEANSVAGEISVLKRKIQELEHEFTQAMHSIAGLEKKNEDLKNKNSESVEAIAIELSNATGHKIEILD